MHVRLSSTAVDAVKNDLLSVAAPHSAARRTARTTITGAGASASASAQKSRRVTARGRGECGACGLRRIGRGARSARCEVLHRILRQAHESLRHLELLILAAHPFELEPEDLSRQRAGVRTDCAAAVAADVRPDRLAAELQPLLRGVAEQSLELLPRRRVEHTFRDLEQTAEEMIELRFTGDRQQLGGELHLLIVPVLVVVLVLMIVLVIVLELEQFALAFELTAAEQLCFPTEIEFIVHRSFSISVLRWTGGERATRLPPQVLEKSQARPNESSGRASEEAFVRSEVRACRYFRFSAFHRIAARMRVRPLG